MRILRGAELGNGTLELEVMSSGDEDIGVAFRCRGPGRHYLFRMNKRQGLREVARKMEGSFETLARTSRAYEVGKWHAIKIVQEDDSLTVFVDGEQSVNVRDPAFGSGTIGLYCQGSHVAQFRNVKWTPQSGANSEDEQ